MIATGAGRFVEAPSWRRCRGQEHRVPILLNGSAAAALADVLSPCPDASRGDERHHRRCRGGQDVSQHRDQGPGSAAAGVHARGREYGAADRVYDSLAETYPGMDWRKTARYMIGRVLEHGERRAHEMEEVATYASRGWHRAADGGSDRAAPGLGSHPATRWTPEVAHGRRRPTIYQTLLVDRRAATADTH